MVDKFESGEVFHADYPVEFDKVLDLPPTVDQLLP